MKKMLTLCALAAAFAIFPQMVFADCADQAVCLYKYDGPQGQTEDRVGIIDTPTCWKVGEHCRPWHCKGNDTSSDYWISKCMRQFLMQHTIGRSKEKACVTFPNVKTSVNGRELFTKDYCRDLN